MACARYDDEAAMELFPAIFGRPANPGEAEDEYIERTSRENFISEGRTYGRGME